MTNKLTYLFLAFALLIFATSCEDEDPPICSCEELVTRVTWTLTPTDAANETVQFSFVDDDGDGGNAPIISSTGTLAANASYTGSVIFAN